MFPFRRLHALRAGTVILLLAVAPARASELGDLRAQLDALKSDYQSKLDALETRVAQLEAQVAAQPQPQPPVVEQPPPPAPSGGGAGGANAFNPSISVILGGRYAQLDADPATYRIAGFMPAGDEVGPGRRGFDLGESELTLSANVDPWFYANLTASITGDNTISVEEAFVKTLALPSGLSLKAGRFFSGHRLPQRSAQPRLGFCRPAAGLSGDVRRPASRRTARSSSGWRRQICSSSSAAETGNGGQFPGHTARASNG
jgi:hypothetical protein